MGLPTSSVPLTPAQLHAPSTGSTAAFRAAGTPMGWSDPHTLIIPLSLSKVLPNGVPTFSPAPHMPTQSCTAYHTLSVCTDSQGCV